MFVTSAAAVFLGPVLGVLMQAPCNQFIFAYSGHIAWQQGLTASAQDEVQNTFTEAIVELHLPFLVEHAVHLAKEHSGTRAAIQINIPLYFTRRCIGSVDA